MGLLFVHRLGVIVEIEKFFLRFQRMRFALPQISLIIRFQDVGSGSLNFLAPFSTSDFLALFQID